MTSPTDDLFDAVAAGSHHDPHSVLGMHFGQDAEGAPEWTIRARRPLAHSVTAVFDDGTRVPLEHVRAGIWEGQRAGEGGSYELVTTYPDAPDFTAVDPYRFAPTIGELDLHLIREGRHEELWRVLGAHVRTIDGVAGTAFSVWAPNARAVRVVGDFNGWDGPAHAMRSMGSSGVWEIFVPGIGVGTAYKFQLLSRGGEWVLKADPMARFAEIPPATASVVTDSGYAWADAAWLKARASSQPVSQPMSIYEVHFGSWRPGSRIARVRTS